MNTREKKKKKKPTGKIPNYAKQPAPPNPASRVLATNLDELSESSVDRTSDGLDVLPEVDGGDSPLGDAGWGEFKLLIDILIGPGGTKAV